MLDPIAAVYHRYGFDPLETSAVETVEALGKFLPDVDRPNEGVFAWQDEDADWLALRYDLTAPLARVAAQYRNDLPSPYRRYAMGPVWRNEKPGPGRFRQFYQCDADTVGSRLASPPTPKSARCWPTRWKTVGIPRGDYVVKVNNRKVLNGVMEVAGVLTGDHKELPRTRHRPAGHRQDRPAGRRRACARCWARAARTRAAISPRARVCDAQRRRPKSCHGLRSQSRQARRRGWPSNDVDAGICRANNALDAASRVIVGTRSGVDGVENSAIAALLDAQGYGPDRIVIDPGVVRGLGYYTGPVFEAELTFEILDEKGRKRQFGSVAGGGRYDELVKRFTGQDVPATGVSIGVDRLLAALRAKGRIAGETAGPVVVTVMDRDRMADYMAHGRRAAPGGHPGRGLSGQPEELRQPVEICRQARSRRLR